MAFQKTFRARLMLCCCEKSAIQAPERCTLMAIMFRKQKNGNVIPIETKIREILKCTVCLDLQGLLDHSIHGWGTTVYGQQCSIPTTTKCDSWKVRVGRKLSSSCRTTNKLILQSPPSCQEYVNSLFVGAIIGRRYGIANSMFHRTLTETLTTL